MNKFFENIITGLETAIMSSLEMYCEGCDCRFESCFTKKQWKKQWRLSYKKTIKRIRCKEFNKQLFNWFE